MPKNTKTSIDQTDKDILNVLSMQARLSYRQIGKKIGKSVATVMNRVKKLESEGVIKGYTTRLNYTKLGYDFPVVVDITVKEAKEIEVCHEIAKNPYVTAVYDITGDFDISILARFKTRAQLDTFIKDLPTQNNIIRTRTKLIMNVFKERNINLE